MENPNSYENVMKELELLADEDYDVIDVSNHLDDNARDFKFEYAFESLTQRHTAYKRRNHDYY